MADIELKNITKRFRTVVALNNVSFNVQEGEFFVLLGPTGAGKTTTLRVIAGLTRQDEGNILFNGNVIDQLTPADRDVAFVFQQYSLYPTMTVYDNLAFPLRSPMRRVPEPEIEQRVKETAGILRIGHLLERKTGNLSGGEMQRVSIGRAIVRQPQLFLMDEPLSNLDAKLRESLRVELQHVQRTQGSTTLFVTHDQVEALTMADRIAVLDRGQIVQIGDPHDIYDRPATIFVAQLVGTPQINLLGATREDAQRELGPQQELGPQLRIRDSDIWLGVGPDMPELPSACLVGVRPEDVRPDNEGEFAGAIALTEPLGVETVLHIRSGSQTLISTQSGMTHWRIGDQIKFNIARERLHFFDEGGNRV